MTAHTTPNDEALSLHRRAVAVDMHADTVQFVIDEGADITRRVETTHLDAARSFAGETQEELDELAFADEHSFDRQRFYNIICLLYGQNEQKFASLVEDGTLPEGRAGRCADEYARADKAWDALLAPYVK